ncbi:peptide chain release factor N(5)-glutamine methyltransferase [Candidatus Uhrbacteria bacterium]|nr:peptide chain release factor N(5)-glutamine methyltransferase [Candidatus Uhrbacteria bacterium]
MRVVDLLTWGKEELKAHTDPGFSDVASPALDAEVLLAHAMGVSKPELFSHLNETPSVEVAQNFRACVDRRLAHEPVAYITGKKFFYNRAFAVSPAVLIPRPETETLIEEALRVIRLYEEHHERIMLMDIGTGSGAIAVTLAAETHEKVWASDLSAEAIAVATENARTHHVLDQITFTTGNLLEPVLPLLRKHSPEHTLITANLPYLTRAQWEEEVQQDIRDFEPRMALEAGVYGLDVYWLFARQLGKARALLGTSCTILCEIDPSQEEKVPVLISEQFPPAEIRVLPDLSKRPRIVRAYL